MINYKFHASSSIESHSIKNLMLTALLELKGNFKEALPVLNKMLGVKGRVLPLTEDSVDLVGITKSGKEIVGEEEITYADEKVIDIKYSDKIKVNKDVIKAIKEADLILFSSGSLLTSIFPHIVVPEIVNEIKKSPAKTLYICNLVTQPGETDGFKVSDHVKMLQKHLGEDGVDMVLANSGNISKTIAKKYQTMEQKDPVPLDESKLEKMNVKVIKDNLISIEDDIIRHDALKTAYLIFKYLMEEQSD